MSDPERLVHRSSDELVRTMLDAARDEAPSRSVKRRTVVAFASGGVTLAAAASSAAMTSATALSTAAGANGAAAGSVIAGSAGASTASAGAGTGLVLVAKWLGIGAVGGVLTAGAATELANPSPPPASIEQHGSASTEPLSARSASPLVNEAPAKNTHSEPALPSAPVSKQPHSEPVSTGLSEPRPAPARTEDDPRALAAEVSSIDRAREALRRKDTARALAELNQYERSFPAGWLTPEALYLQMEALLQQGNEPLARSVADRLLRAHPKSPQAARARVVLSRPNP